MPIVFPVVTVEMTMGYNRAGYRAKKSERRRKKEERRLAGKATPTETKGVDGTVKRADK